MAEHAMPEKQGPAPMLGCVAVLNTLPRDVFYVAVISVDFLMARNAAVPFRMFANGDTSARPKRV